MPLVNGIETSVASTPDTDLESLASEGVSLPQECLSALGALYSPKPLKFSDVASLATNSNALRDIRYFFGILRE